MIPRLLDNKINQEQYVNKFSTKYIENKSTKENFKILENWFVKVQLTFTWNHFETKNAEKNGDRREISQISRMQACFL